MKWYLVNPGGERQRRCHRDGVAVPVAAHAGRVISQAVQQGGVVSYVVGDVPRQGQLSVHNLAHQQAQHPKNAHRDVPGGAQEGVDDAGEEGGVDAVDGVQAGQQGVGYRLWDQEDADDDARHDVAQDPLLEVVARKPGEDWEAAQDFVFGSVWRARAALPEPTGRGRRPARALFVNPLQDQGLSMGGAIFCRGRAVVAVTHDRALICRD